MAVIRNVQVEVEGEEQTFPLGALAENIEESTEKQFVSASEKKKLNAQPIKVTLTAVGWSGSADSAECRDQGKRKLYFDSRCGWSGAFSMENVSESLGYNCDWVGSSSGWISDIFRIQEASNRLQCVSCGGVTWEKF